MSIARCVYYSNFIHAIVYSTELSYHTIVYGIELSFYTIVYSIEIEMSFYTIAYSIETVQNVITHHRKITIPQAIGQCQPPGV